jgi:hypothetical protein
VSVGDQADGNVDLCDLGIEGSFVVNVELVDLAIEVRIVQCCSYADGGSILDALGQSLGLLQGPASNRDFDARVSEDLSSWTRAMLVLDAI